MEASYKSWGGGSHSKYCHISHKTNAKSNPLCFVDDWWEETLTPWVLLWTKLHRSMFCCDVLLLAAYIVAWIVITAYNFFQLAVGIVWLAEEEKERGRKIRASRAVHFSLCYFTPVELFLECGCSINWRVLLLFYLHLCLGLPRYLPPPLTNVQQLLYAFLFPSCVSCPTHLTQHHL